MWAGRFLAKELASPAPAPFLERVSVLRRFSAAFPVSLPAGRGRRRTDEGDRAPIHGGIHASQEPTSAHYPRSWQTSRAHSKPPHVALIAAAHAKKG